MGLGLGSAGHVPIVAGGDERYARDGMSRKIEGFAGWKEPPKHIRPEAPRQIRLASVMVDNQENALRFYTTVLGFVKKEDIPMGTFRWLTVSSPEGAEGVELVLEPIGFAPARTYQKALFAASIPATAFIANNIDSEYRRLHALGVSFPGEPKNMGPSITTVLFEDTCGNLINLVQPTP
jgi:predicted enzyme related to lactoylglutathione lyase